MSSRVAEGGASVIRLSSRAAEGGASVIRLSSRAAIIGASVSREGSGRDPQTVRSISTRFLASLGMTAE
ncbi:MAG: hypothetical protein PHV77_02320 [Candidatus Omnitrophica bacterium]|nr:hypothetical protein [Candidatus Omnitrophota bacterium]